MAVARRALPLALAAVLAPAAAAAHASTPPPKPKIVIGVDGVEGKTGKTALGGTFFDLSDSVATKGHRLTTATLRFGDKTKPRSFKGNPVNWQADHNYAKTGTYTITVTVKQNDGVTNTRKERVSVYVPPAVTVNGPVTSVYVGQSVTVSTATSTPAGTHWQSYAYTWGDTNAQTVKAGAPPASFSHVFTKTGTFIFGLAVSNDANGTASGSYAITVRN